MTYNRQNPFMSEILSRSRLNKTGSLKETWHVCLNLRGSGIAYKPGDSFGIFAENDPMAVETILEAVECQGSEPVVDPKTQQSHFFKDWLLKKANLAKSTKKLYSLISSVETDADKAAKAAHLLAPDSGEEFQRYLSSHTVEELLASHSCEGIQPQQVVDSLMPLMPRFYSVASSQKMVGDEVHLTVARVVYIEEDKVRRGVCSHFLCDLAPVKQPVVPIYLQPAHDFFLPVDLATNIIMIGPGTGVAPFRGFMQERMAAEAPGQNWLFFGERQRAYDFLYQDFWEDLVACGKLKLDCAFSRDTSSKVYVQHRLWEHKEELWKWLENGAVFYVCGDASQMAKDVDKVLHEIIESEGQMDAAAAKKYVKDLKAQKRYQRDVY